MRHCLRKVLLFVPVTLALVSCEELVPDPAGQDIRSVLEGTWRVEEDSEVFSRTIYLVEIEKHQRDTTRVYIYNFYNVDAVVEVLVNGRSLSIPEQDTQGGYRFSGRGTLAGNNGSISWQYTIDDGSGEVDNATAVYTPF